MHCSPATNDPITDEIMGLTSFTDKKDFLEKVYKDNKGGMKNLPLDIAEINQKKIGTYLELFGHPKISEVGSIAAQTPWLIIHDNRDEDRIEIRTKYFPILFKAFLKGDINDSQMSMFLNRFYEFKFGKKYIKEDTFSPKKEINTLIGLLNLETSMN